MPPAARIGDIHVCPMVTGVVPHVGGPVVAGCPTVLIGFMPAARIGDALTCVGPPDVIVMGSATVLIGFMPAARIGDTTAHGGNIVLGCPTVLIGDAGGAGGDSVGGRGAPGAGGNVEFDPMTDPGEEQYCNNLTIVGSKEFREKVKQDLDELKGTPTGQKILDAIANGRHPITIKELDKASAQANGGLCEPDDADAASDPSKGSPSTVSYSPEHSADQYTDQNGNLVDHPSKAYLGHELIHAVHASEGTDESGTPDPAEPGSNQEESKTIGINDHKDDEMTENNLLEDLGYDYKRTDHDMSAHSNP